MPIFIFIIVLAILIFIHELGHFIFAKKTGMLVEEFAVGFPPRIFSRKKGETRYSIGVIPLGGYCKILGEDYEDPSDVLKNKEDKNYSRRFTNQSKKAQASVLVAGVAFNFLLAWILFSVGFMSGMPVSTSQFDKGLVENSNLILVDIMKNSPAEKAGLEIGDKILFMENNEQSIQDFETSLTAETLIASSEGQEISILYKRGGTEPVLTQITPSTEILEGKPAIGVSLDVVGEVRLSFFRAFWEGARTTISLTTATMSGLSKFVVGIFTGTSNMAQISGPVGIVSMVGNAFEFGLVYLMSFVALISINLGVINLIPIPALDGGRLLFLGIEAIKGSPIKSKTANLLNFLGFVFLMILMLIVTVGDISKIFG